MTITPEIEHDLLRFSDTDPLPAWIANALRPSDEMLKGPSLGLKSPHTWSEDRFVSLLEGRLLGYYFDEIGAPGLLLARKVESDTDGFAAISKADEELAKFEDYDIQVLDAALAMPHLSHGMKSNVLTVLEHKTDSENLRRAALLLVLANHPDTSEKIFKALEQDDYSSVVGIAVEHFKLDNQLDEVIYNL